ncbi:MAG: ABC transporter ATP-binding protein [Candidatus Calescibacterium sp.]
MVSDSVVIRVERLRKYFPVRRNIKELLRPSFVRAVDGVSLEIRRGEFFGLVGESGCGKSTLGRLIAKIIQPTSGKIIFNGEDITFKKLKGEKRRKIQMIFQNPFSSLNPKMKVKDLILEGIIIHKIYPKSKLKEKLEELLESCGLGMEFAERFPDELSGGQRQRVAIARAIAVEPEVLVADEPTSSLDVSVRAQILELFEDIRRKMNLSIFFISHDLHTIRAYADRVAVMYLGEIVEIGQKDQIFSRPLHPYTYILLKSVIDIQKVINEGRYEIGMENIGEAPSPLEEIKGCKFASRCPFKDKICEEKKPELTEIDGRQVSCHFAGKLKLLL